MCFIEQMYETNNPLLNENRFNQKWVQKLALGVKRSNFDTIFAILLYFHSIWLLNE